MECPLALESSHSATLNRRATCRAERPLQRRATGCLGSLAGGDRSLLGPEAAVRLQVLESGHSLAPQAISRSFAVGIDNESPTQLRP
jgi:hypothetical protein